MESYLSKSCQNILVILNKNGRMDISELKKQIKNKKAKKYFWEDIQLLRKEKYLTHSATTWLGNGGGTSWIKIQPKGRAFVDNLIEEKKKKRHIIIGSIVAISTLIVSIVTLVISLS